MNSWVKRGLIVAIGVAAGASSARGQVIERDTTVTGPGGRSIERHLRSERGPGYVDREVRVQRPGGTIERNTRVQGPAVRRDLRVERQQGVVHAPPRVVGRGVIVEHEYVRPRTSVSVGVAAPFFGLVVGAPPPPPPVVYVPEPVIVEAPPTVIYQPPVRYAPPRTVVIDPVAAALARLRSSHDNSRRDGCKTLGQLGDARAVPALIDRLRRDEDEDVREAAAWALGQIGDPAALPELEVAARHDRKRDVREAATRAYHALPREVTPVDPPTEAEPAPSAELPQPLPGFDDER